MKPGPIKEKVIAEGAEIHCERRGNGPLLLLITGSMGDAGSYSSAAEILANEFTIYSKDYRVNNKYTIESY
jgi:hypothetical protein